MRGTCEPRAGRRRIGEELSTIGAMRIL